MVDYPTRKEGIVIGITSYGAYVPLYRLGQNTTGWTTPAERAVANFDEDSITMSVAAAMDCLNGVERSAVDTLYSASTTSPYKEKSAATTVATAADLKTNLLAADFTNSLRAGTMAVKAAVDAVKAGSAQQALVTAADMRIAQPRSDFEATFGDGAAALLIGSSPVAAAIEDSYSLAEEIVDIWRSEEDVFVRSWEDRFVLEQGYLRVLPQAVSALLRKHGLSPQDFARAVFYAPDGRRHQEMARKLGFDLKTQVPAPLFNTLGNTGAALAPLMLIAALEEAKPGERILWANYGNGADVFILRVTEEITNIRNRRGVRGYLASRRILDNYQRYANWRGLISLAPVTRRPPNPIPSAAALHRERDQNIRLYGSKCQSCGYPQYPPQRVCTICHTRDKMESCRFSDKKATVFTYTQDFLALTPDPPLVIAVLNFAGGGRIVAQMTDCDPKELKVGMPVEMSFRRIFEAGGIHNYFWKCVPVRA